MSILNRLGAQRTLPTGVQAQGRTGVGQVREGRWQEQAMWTKGRCRLQRVAQRYKGGEAGNEGLLATRTPRACRGLLLPQRLFPKGEEQAGHDWQGPPPRAV